MAAAFERTTSNDLMKMDKKINIHKYCTDRQKKIAESERDLLELKESTFSVNV
jgi:hypothetical protein